MERQPKKLSPEDGTGFHTNSVVLNTDEYELKKFPREFERSFADLIDKRFAMILLASFLVHFSTVLYYVKNPPPAEITREEINRIQKQFAKLVLDKELVEQPVTEDFSRPHRGLVERETRGTSEGKGGSGVEKGKGSGRGKGTGMATAEERQVSRGATAAARRLSREQISREVSSKGILGLLVATGSAASGEGAEDVLSDIGSTGKDLDEVLGSLDGLKQGAVGSGQPGAGGQGTGSGIRGGRTTSGAGIDELVGELGTAKSSTLSRKGELVVATVSPVEDDEGVKIVNRDPDKVSEVVNSHNAAIQYCYQRELKQNPELKGKLVIRFTIAPEGYVKEAKIISSTLNNRNVEQCVLSRIRRWDNFGAIDPSKGDATFRQVYTFGY
ncbi:MAG: AgmX/PglI C-terminal domain-containing protein [candidate division KSB1 bacterium]|nr:AgmX/PglI C-terminal domain-containing protein [candidate division KSB1 bacterium]